MESKSLFYKFDSLFIFLVGVVFLLNALKPWIDYVTGLNYQVITIVQFLTLLFVITVLNKSFYKRIDIFSVLLLFFILEKFLVETFFDFLEGDTFAIISSLYVVFRTFLIVYLLQVLLTFERGVKIDESLKFLLLGYFFVTFSYSIMQHPQFFDLSLMREYGGNSVSGNQWGFFRTNGGIGGTAVDYANFLLAISWVLMFSFFKSRKTQAFFLFIFVASVVLCFSRALFLCLFFIFMVHSISFKNLPRVILSVILLMSMSLLTMLNLDLLLDAYSNFSDSDLKRIGSWQTLFHDFSVLEYIVGRDLGGNTGLFQEGVNKISGDGFITGFTYDAGIVALILLIGVILYKVFSIQCNLRIKISIFGSLMLMLVINSGFEKLFLVMVYVISIGIVSYSFKFRRAALR